MDIVEYLLGKKAGGGGGVIPDAVKTALTNIFGHVAYTDDDGMQYLSDLMDAFGIEIVSISAALSESAVIYSFDTLDAVREYLTVTAHYQGGIDVAVTDYTLSGSLSSQTNTITVDYGGKTTTVSVSTTSISYDANTYSREILSEHEIYIMPNAVSARARMTAPLINRNYVFTVTDPSKYNISVYSVTDPTPVYLSQFQKYGYAITSDTVGWGASGASNTGYVVMSFKKMDDTDFTESEMLTMYGTVYTVSTGA